MKKFLIINRINILLAFCFQITLAMQPDKIMVISPLISMLALNSPKPLTNLSAIKGLHEVIKSEYSHLSPINGFLLGKSPFLQNLYQFGNPKHSTHKVITSLFHKLDNQVRPTQHAPASSITAEVAGTIVGAIETGILPKNNAAKKDILHLWERTHNKISTQSFYSDAAKKILNRCEAAAQECAIDNPKAFYMPGIMQSTIVSYLSEKPHATKEDLITYLKTVHKYMPILKSDVDLDEMLYEEYTKKEKDEHIHLMNTLDAERLIKKISNEEYEKAAYALTEQHYLNAIPPIITQKAYSYQSRTAAPDCMETAMRTLCYWLLSNKQEPTINFSVLPDHIEHNLPAETKQYFTQFGQFATVNTQEAGQAWMNLVSNKPNIHYNREIYELMPTAHNVINLLNALFNVHASNFKELGDCLSTADRKISFDIQENNPSTTKIKIMIGSHILEMNLQPNHARMEIPKQNSLNALYHNPHISEVALKRFAKEKNSQLMALLPFLIRDHHDLSNDRCTPEEYKSAMHIALSVRNLEDPNKLCHSLCYLLENINEISGVKDTIVHWLSLMPQDNYFMEVLGKHIAKSQAYTCDKRIEEFLTQHPSSLLGAINEIKKADVSKLLEWIQAPVIPKSEQYQLLIGKILGKHLLFDQTFYEFIKQHPIILHNKIIYSIEMLRSIYAQELLKKTDLSRDQIIENIFKEINLLPDEQQQYECLKYYANAPVSSEFLSHKLCNKSLYHTYKKFPNLIFDIIKPLCKAGEINQKAIELIKTNVTAASNDEDLEKYKNSQHFFTPEIAQKVKEYLYNYSFNTSNLRALLKLSPSSSYKEIQKQLEVNDDEADIFFKFKNAEIKKNIQNLDLVFDLVYHHPIMLEALKVAVEKEIMNS